MLDEKIAKHIRSIIWGIKGPDWKGMPPQLTQTRVAAFKGNNGPAPPPVWALIELPEGITNEEFLKPLNWVRTDHDGMMVILAPFPWELNVTQHYKILHIAEEVLEEDIRKEVGVRLGARITEKAQLMKRKDHKGRAIWNMTLTFDLRMVDVEPNSIGGPDQVVDMLGLHERQWLVQGREWMVYNGDHCVGCHGRGHVITDCQFFSLLHPIDYYPNEDSPPK